MEITGVQLPQFVEVLFNGNVACPASCDPVMGKISVRTPIGLLGDVPVLVRDASNQCNAHEILLRFNQRELPRPYHEHISRELLRERRVSHNLNQTQVAEALRQRLPDLKVSQRTISAYELGKMNPSDEVIIALAKVYQCRVIDFFESDDTATN